MTKIDEKKDEEELIKNPINVFCCGNCKDSEAMQHKDFLKHLEDVHGIKPPLKGSKQMTMHMDGSYWFSSVYEWKLEAGVNFTQSIRMARSKGDAMRHG